LKDVEKVVKNCDRSDISQANYFRLF